MHVCVTAHVLGRMATIRRRPSDLCVPLCLLVLACAGEVDKEGGRSFAEPVDSGAVRPMPDARPADFGNADDDASVRLADIDAAPRDASVCAKGMAVANPVTPTVWLVIDASSSMNMRFGSITRWTALRGALMNRGGVVQTLQAGVRFGMVIYNGNHDAAELGIDCVNLVTVDPKRDNWSTLADAYPAQEIGGWTPTDRALEEVVTRLPDPGGAKANADRDPVYAVLATDGAPNDICAGANVDAGTTNPSAFDPLVAQRVVEQVAGGVKRGMKTFVISLAGDDEELAAHLDELASRGATGSPVFEPTTQAQLVETLRDVIGQTTCSVELNGTVRAGRECEGTVRLNGAPLVCNDPHGWRMVDERTVQLEGAGCDTFLGMASEVTAEFPCEVFAPD